MKVCGFIFARGGSKGIPHKNITPLCGRPLICYAIEQALQSRYLDEIYVSTDDPEIAAVAENCGATVPFLRPESLARDNSSEWLAWQHAVKTLNADGIVFDLFVTVPATSPLRSPEDIDACIRRLMDEDDADGVITVVKSHRHPAFNMVYINDSGDARIAHPAEKLISNRQETSEIFDITTVAYAVRPEFILKAGALFEGRIRTVEVPVERSLDIDTPFDLKLAELILNDKKNNSTGQVRSVSVK